VKLHLSNTNEDETDIEKEWKNLQNILKSAAYESLGTINRQNRRKYRVIQNDCGVFNNLSYTIHLR